MLSILYLKRNILNGPIPDAFGLLSQIKEFHVGKLIAGQLVGLSGVLPDSLRSWTELEDLQVLCHPMNCSSFVGKRRIRKAFAGLHEVLLLSQCRIVLLICRPPVKHL